MKQICLSGIMLMLLIGLVACSNLPSNKDNAESYFKSGLTHDDKGETEKAIEDYTKAIELKPDFAEAYNNRGVDYYTKFLINPKRSILEKAISDFNKAIELNPHNDEFYYNRGSAYFEKPEFDKAISDYNKVIELNPQNRKVLHLLDITRKVKSENENDLVGYVKIVEFYPDAPEVYLRRAYIYYRIGEKGKAITDLEMFIKLVPTSDENVPRAKQMIEKLKQLSDK